MRAIILAAGRGTRLGRIGDEDLPKCLLRFGGYSCGHPGEHSGGRSLLERHLAILRDAGVDEIVLALGFKPEWVAAELERIGRVGDVEIVMNPGYELGSVLTVHAAADAMTRGGDVLLMDADVLYDRRIIDVLVAGDHADRLLIDRDFESGEEPVKVCLRDGVPVEFRKRVAPGTTYDTIGESVGFFRFREETARRLMTIVDRYVASGRSNLPHEEAIRDLLLEEPAPGSNRAVDGLDVADVTGMPWIEIDFPEDVVRADREICPLVDATQEEVTNEGRRP